MNDCNGVTMTTITNTVRTKYSYVTPNRSPISPTCFANGNGVIYRVELPVEFDLPLLGGLRWMIVKAETKTIQNTTC